MSPEESLCQITFCVMRHRQSTTTTTCRPTLLASTCITDGRILFFRGASHRKPACPNQRRAGGTNSRQLFLTYSFCSHRETGLSLVSFSADIPSDNTLYDVPRTLQCCRFMARHDWHQKRPLQPVFSCLHHYGIDSSEPC